MGVKKRTVTWGNVRLGQGMPKICVPVMGHTPEQVFSAAVQAAKAGADVVELRLDSLAPLPGEGLVRLACDAVRSGAPDAPLLLTLRTVRDGGAGSGDAADYEAMLCEAARERLCAAIDVELSAGEAAFSRLAAEAHAAGVSVVGSSHDFARTPGRRELVERLATMERWGADVCKAAVMPQGRADALVLMQACAEADERLQSPVIAIAMGPLGALTRLGAEAFGSCLTFGTAGRQSAPGQVDARALRRTLEAVHDALSGKAET